MVYFCRVNFIQFYWRMKKRVLVVEDEIAMRKALEIKLQGSGFLVETAHDAEEFFQKKEKNQYDLFLLDLMLPKVSGFEILERLKTGKNSVPVIITSNLSQEEDKKRAKDLGAVDYIVKSDVSLADMIVKLKAFFGE